MQDANKRCFHCKLPSHLARQCPRRTRFNTRGGRGHGRGGSARFGENSMLVNYTHQVDEVDEGFDIPRGYAYVIQAGIVQLSCYNALMATKNQELAWIMLRIRVQTLQCHPRCLCLPMRSTFSKVHLWKSWWEGGTKITSNSNQVALFRTTSGLSFLAHVMTTFGPNILPVHTFGCG